MKNVLLKLLVLSGCVGQVFGSEKNDEIVIFDAHVGRLTYNPLRYCDKKYIDFLNNEYGIQCQQNEPFLMIYYQWTRGEKSRWASEEEQSLQKFLDPITLVPYRYFMKDNIDPRKSNVSFKERHDELLSCSKQFEGMENGFKIQLNTSFDKMDPQVFLNQFKEMPCCEPGHIENEGSVVLTIVPTKDLEKELCDAGIICKRELREAGTHKEHLQEYAQGINGYFGKEVKEEIRQDYKAIKTALFYSRIKKLFGASIVGIIAYVLYQKFYAAA